MQRPPIVSKGKIRSLAMAQRRNAEGVTGLLPIGTWRGAWDRPPERSARGRGPATRDAPKDQHRGAGEDQDDELPDGHHGDDDGVLAVRRREMQRMGVECGATGRADQEKDEKNAAKPAGCCEEQPGKAGDRRDAGSQHQYTDADVGRRGQGAGDQELAGQIEAVERQRR